MSGERRLVGRMGRVVLGRIRRVLVIRGKMRIGINKLRRKEHVVKRRLLDDPLRSRCYKMIAQMEKTVG